MDGAVYQNMKQKEYVIFCKKVSKTVEHFAVSDVYQVKPIENRLDDDRWGVL